MLKHMLAGRAAKRRRGYRFSESVDQFNSCHKVFQRTRVIKKTVLAV